MNRCVALPLVPTILLAVTASASELPRAVTPQGACLELASEARPAGLPPLALAVTGQLFATGDVTFVEGDSFSEVRLDRAVLGVCLAHASWGGGYAAVEAIRSAGRESLIGIDGDSIVLRVKQAVAFVRPTVGPGVLVAQVGLVPDPWVQALDHRNDVRAVMPSLSERAFFDASDLGASVGYRLFEGRLAATVSVVNGEGRAQREQNDGKNVTVVISGAPLALELLGGTATLGLHGVWRDGSLGVGRAKDHRLGAALTLVHPRATLGLEWVHADGISGRGEVTADGLGLWATVLVWSPWVGAYFRAESLTPDTAVDDGGASTLAVGLYADLVSQELRAQDFRLRAYLGYSGRSYGAQASPLPGAGEVLDSDRVMLTVELGAFAVPLGASAE